MWDSYIDEGFDLSIDPFELNADAFNCGSCDTICYYPKSFILCIDGECQFDGCYNGYYNVNNDLELDGCEYLCTPNISEPGGETICSDGEDNDCDGAIDGSDVDCQ